MQVHLQDERVEVRVANEHYSAATLHKCFYWYTRDYRVEITLLDKDQTQVLLTPKEAGQNIDFPLLQSQVHNDLLDFRLRELIAEETRTVRELLIAKAFAHYAPQQPLEASISDPVGFHPLSKERV
jgi:His-Xaa-Ser system protein HxsD